MLSHELRTPLSAVLGWAELLLRTGPTMEAGQVKRAVEVIDRNARAQVKLIDDLLDLNRIITGKLRLELQRVSMHDVVQIAVDSAMPAASAKGIRLHALSDPGPSTVRADGSRLQQVVWNLLNNAIKFTPEGGQVQVRLRRADPCMELSVSDTGIGISASFLPHVFDRFSQRESSTTRSFLVGR
jgi:signal transduction histidine kinase